ncbi:MAG TPA: hypothetical protein VNI82_00105 [Candidatus Nitrosotenuis sp.]|nr:hypothetical protein [Candidatus Nitrosotenuis sp.]
MDTHPQNPTPTSEPTPPTPFTTPPDTSSAGMQTPLSTSQASPTASSEPRNFLVTFLLTILGGYVGLRHYYLGDMKLGFLRTGLFLGGYVWLFVMLVLGQTALAFLGTIATLVAFIWAVVDFFVVYFSVKTDKDGQPLVTTIRDKKWAKVIFWVTVGVSVVALLFAIFSASWAENTFRNQMNNGSGSSSFDRSFDSSFPSEIDSTTPRSY